MVHSADQLECGRTKMDVFSRERLRWRLTAHARPVVGTAPGEFQSLGRKTETLATDESPLGLLAGESPAQPPPC
jgi:hypothetical protein